MSASSLPIPIFLGYCAKRIWVPTAEWCGAWGGHIGEIASVSGCLSSYPPNWIDRWDFNRCACWNDEASALAAVPPTSLADFRLFCYRLIPILFGASGDAATVSLDDLFPAGLPDPPSELALPSYRRVGYDIVEAPLTLSVLGFGCSPLSCNGMAEEIPVNRFCLLDNLDTALAIAKRFGAEQPEPGPYLIIEVLK